MMLYDVPGIITYEVKIENLTVMFFRGGDSKNYACFCMSKKRKSSRQMKNVSVVLCGSKLSRFCFTVVDDFVSRFITYSIMDV